MSDEGELAEAAEARFRESALRAARSQVSITPEINCLDTCGANVPHGKECTYYKDCLQDWEREQRRTII